MGMGCAFFIHFNDLYLISSIQTFFGEIVRLLLYFTRMRTKKEPLQNFIRS